MKLKLILLLALLIGCSKDSDIAAPESRVINFGQPQKVNILGYDNHIMEPFLSGDGGKLFFNNSNDPSVNTNIHFAAKINDSTFQYQGELKGINTDDLEGTPTLDDSGSFYFVSTRSYNQTLSTIYKCTLLDDSVSNVQLVSGVSRNQAGWVNFDCEISKDGNTLFSVDGRFDVNGGPYESNFFLAAKTNNVFQRSVDLTFENINTDALEYAACISSDMLELYFTRVDAPLTALSITQIYVATRNSVNEPFRTPYKLEAAAGFVEGPTISPDNQILYYHKKENDKFVLYMIRKE